MKLAAGFACLIAISAPMPAPALSGAELYQLCQDRGSDGNACNSFILGFASGLLLGHENGMIVSRSNARWYCPPSEGLTVAQGRLIVEKYLREHPDQLHFDVGFLVFDALTTAFPCRK